LPRQIANPDACMLRLYATDAPAQSLPIGRTPPRTRPASCAADPAAPRWDRVIDFVAAGCLAYDSNVIIAASELVPVSVTHIAAVLPGVPEAAACATEGAPCYHADDPAHAFFGACVAGTCQPRCASPADCDLAGEVLLDRVHSETNGWECRALPTSRVGVCAPS